MWIVDRAPHSNGTLFESSGTVISIRSKRSFSALKVVIRSSMTEQRLNYCFLLHIHKDLTNSCNCWRHTVNTEHRNYFGVFHNSHSFFVFAWAVILCNPCERGDISPPTPTLWPYGHVVLSPPNKYVSHTPLMIAKFLCDSLNFSDRRRLTLLTTGVGTEGALLRPVPAPPPQYLIQK